ncbi:MAG: beta,2-mannobiose phosphorylase / 1,2-beta-oligomannan phosphorylase [Patescibacteria group bacterium]|nr:beta,2-mannobiose phosphorylase / 1,2-beta-oligomannan phosphorylase [Patescibacteria group bacterium]
MIKKKLILEKTDNEFEINGVFNPGCYQEGDFVHMFYRAISSTMNSSIGYVKLDKNNQVVERWNEPIINRDFDCERHGVEDARIVKVEDIFYVFYVAYDGKNAVTAYATGSDLFNLQKKGIITPTIKYSEAREIMKSYQRYVDQADLYIKNVGEDVLFWAKDVFLFPEKINGKFYMMIRVLPDIQIISFDSFDEINNDFWINQLKNINESIVIDCIEGKHVGGGCPPIKTPYGWLIIFHSVDDDRIYHTSVALLDLNNPLKVISRLKEPLFSPTEYWEKEGVVSNVVFATGSAILGDKLCIYYGAADKRIGVAELSLKDLLKKLC